jgi:hypothetical protein
LSGFVAFVAHRDCFMRKRRPRYINGQYYPN